jgi:hypothetical protein
MAFEADVPEHFERLIGPGVLTELNKKERPL